MNVNLTLSADKKILERARQVAQRQGTSLNQMIRNYLKSLSMQITEQDSAAELYSLMDEGAGNLNGQRWSRDEIYQR